MALILLTVYSLISIVIPVIGWWQTHPLGLSFGDASIALYSLGQLLALVGLSMLLTQPVLASRWHWLERPFGLDRVYHFHKRTGQVATILLLLHPLLLDASYWLIDSASFINYLLPKWDWRLVGEISIILLVALVILALYRRRLGLSYHWWRRLHLLMYAVLLGGFLHSLFLGSNLVSGWLRYYWLGLGSLAAIVFLYRHIILKIKLYRRPYQIVQLKQETPDVLTVTLQPKSGQRFVYQPGQFMFIQFMSRAVKGEWHPFTISSSPTEKNLTVSMKACGDWTKTLSQLTMYELALIEGPFGQFSYTKHTTTEPLVFIAGGIGITPLRSMIKHLADTNSTQPVTLLYSARSEQDLAFIAELQQLSQQHPTIQLWASHTERITSSVIQQQVKEHFTQAHYFICGPQVMMTALKQQLRLAGIPKQQLHTEEFAL